MLDVGAGNEEEHAVLLNNFFLSRKMKSFVLLGKSSIGRGAFVVVEEEIKDETNSKRYRICDPVNGNTFISNNNFLDEAHVIFNEENVNVSII
jgi:hypothetical protein